MALIIIIIIIISLVLLFQKALQMSLLDAGGPGCGAGAVGTAGGLSGLGSEEVQLKRAMQASLQNAIRDANMAEIYVFANYSHDLIRTEIALGKKASLRQCEEKVSICY